MNKLGRRSAILVVLLLLCMVLSFALVACVNGGGGDEPDPTPTPGPEPSTQSEVTITANRTSLAFEYDGKFHKPTYTITNVETGKKVKDAEVVSEPATALTRGFRDPGQYKFVLKVVESDQYKAAEVSAVMTITESGDVDDGSDVNISKNDIFTMIADGMSVSENILGIDVSLSVDYPRIENGSAQKIVDTYTVSLKGNLVGSRGNELIFSVERTHADGVELETPELYFALYIDDARAYVQVGGEIFWLSDFDINYVASFLDYLISGKDPSLEPTPGEASDAATADLDIGAIISGFIGSSMDDPVAKFDPIDDSLVNVSAALYPTALLESVNSLLGSIDIWSLIKMIAPGINFDLPLNVLQLLEYLTNELIPQVKIEIQFSYDTSANNALVDNFIGLTVTGNDPSDSVSYQEELLGVEFKMAITDEKFDIDMPTFESPRIFSFTNIEFAIDLHLDTELTAQGEAAQIDLADIINMFLSADQQIPSGLLKLSLEFGLRLNFKLDLDLNYENDPIDRNLLAVELFLIDRDGEILKEEDGALIGIYYREGALYLQYENLVPAYWSAKNIKIDTDLSALMNFVVTTVKGAIEGAVADYVNPAAGEQSAQALAFGGQRDGVASYGTRLTANDYIASDQVSQLYADGDKGVISPAVYKVFQHIFMILPGWDKFIQVGSEDGLSPDADRIRITANNELLDYIDGLVRLIGTDAEGVPGAGFDFRLPEGIGNIYLDVNLDREIGLKDVSVTGTVEDKQGVELGLRLAIGRFLIGLENPDLDARIDRCVSEAKRGYANTLNELIYNVLGKESVADPDEGGIQINAKFSMQFNRGVYDIGKFLEGFGSLVPEIGGIFSDTPLLWTFTEDFVLDAVIRIQVCLNKVNPEKSTIIIELVTEKGIYIGSEELMAPGSVMLGIYGYNNELYIDATNIKIAKITLPRLKAKFNFTDFVFKYLNEALDNEALVNVFGKDFANSKFALDLVGLLNPAKGNQTASGGENADPDEALQQALGLLFSEGGQSPDLTSAGQIIVGMNAEKLTIDLTLKAIVSLLNAIDGNMLSDEIQDLLSNKIDLSLDVTGARDGGFVANLNINKLIPMVQYDVFGEGGSKQLIPRTDANGKYLYEDESAYRLNMSLEAGTQTTPIRIGNLDDLKRELNAQEMKFDQYESNISKALLDTFGKAQIDLQIDMKTFSEIINVNRIINNILAASGQELKLPINLHLDDTTTKVVLSVRWKLDPDNPRNTQLSVQFTYYKEEGGVYDEGNLMLGLYLYRNNIIADLRGLGLFECKITNSPLVKKITDAIADVLEKMANFDLTEILEGLISGSKKTAALSDESGDAIGASGALDQETMDLIAMLITGVSATNSNIFLNVTADMLQEVFIGLLGFDMGVDLSVGGKLDAINGELALNIRLAEIDLALKMNLNIGENPLNLRINDSIIDSWDMSNPQTFALTLLKKLDIAFTLDLAMSSLETEGMENAGDGGSDNNKLYTRIKIEKLKSARNLGSNALDYVAPKDSYLIGMFTVDRARYLDTSKGSETPILYMIYDVDAKTIKPIICKGVIILDLAVKYDLGSMFGDIMIPNVDLVSTIANALGGLFIQMNGVDPLSESEDSGSSAVATAGMEDLGAAFTEMFANFDVQALFNGGIDIYLRSTGLFNVNADMNAYMVNKLIDDVMGLIFGENSKLNLQELAGFSRHYLKEVKWDRTHYDTFWQSLKGVLPGIIADAVTIYAHFDLAEWVVSGIINTVAYSVRRLVARLLPLPLYNDFSVGLNLVDGTISDLYVLGYDDNEPIVDENGNVLSSPYGGQYVKCNNPSTSSGAYLRRQYSLSKDSVSGFFTEIRLYNSSSSVGSVIRPTENGSGNSQQVGLVNWDTLNTNIVYEPYEHADPSQTIGGVPLGKKELMDEFFYNKTATYMMGASINKTTIGFAIAEFTPFGENGELDASRKTVYASADRPDVDSMDITKAGVYKIVATAMFESAAKTFTKEVKLTVYGADEIVSIGEMKDGAYVPYLSQYVYQDIVDYVWIQTRSIAGNISERRISTKAFTLKDADPIGFKAHVVEKGTVVVENEIERTLEPKAVFANGKEASISIHYLDSTIDTVTMDGAENNEIVIDLYTFSRVDVNDPVAVKKEIDKYLPETLYFRYPSGFSDKQPVVDSDVTVLVSQLFGKQDSDGWILPIELTIGATKNIRQTKEMIVRVKSKTVSSVSVNGQKNQIQVDPYVYYLYATLMAEANALRDEAAKDVNNSAELLAQAQVKETEAEQYNPYLHQVDVEYYGPIYEFYKEGEDWKKRAYEKDGVAQYERYTDQVWVTWENNGSQNVDYTWDGSNDIVLNKRVLLDKTKQDGDQPLYSGDWGMQADIKVLLARNEIERVYFDEAMSVTQLEINPYVFYANKDAGRGGDNFPDQAWVQFTNGSVIKLPIAWQKEVVDWNPTYEGTLEQFRITIGFDTGLYELGKDPQTVRPVTGVDSVVNMMQNAYVTVVVDDVVATGIDLDGSSYRKGTTFYIDPVKVKYFGESVFPQSATILYANSTPATLGLTWKILADNGEWVDEAQMYDALSDLKGRESLTARAYLPGKDVYFDIACKVLNRDVENLVYDRAIHLNPYAYQTSEDGLGRSYDVFADKLPVQYRDGWSIVYSVANSREEKTLRLTQDQKEQYEELKAYLLTTEESYTLGNGGWSVTFEEKVADGTYEARTEYYYNNLELREFVAGLEAEPDRYRAIETVMDELQIEQYVSYELPLDRESWAIPESIKEGTYSATVALLGATEEWERKIGFDVRIDKMELHSVDKATPGEYTLVVYKGGGNLSLEGQLTGKETKTLDVFFNVTDEEGKTELISIPLKCTIDVGFNFNATGTYEAELTVAVDQADLSALAGKLTVKVQVVAVMDGILMAA